jgi:pimeloyl-ACP methyl ester carboxylesterase
MVLNGVDLACGVIKAVNALDEGAAATCSFISKVVTTIERFVRGPKRGSTLKNLTKDDGKKIPLILIHGIHGSDNLNEISYDSPYWSNFITRFKANSALTSAFALYAYQYYSDAESVQNIAAHLGRYIDGKLQGRSHVLLAHSMGGLVAKSYMVEGGGAKTLLLITLATPHHGTPAANDAAALRQYMRGEDWYKFFSKANFAYWLLHAGHLSGASYTSLAYNRSDLRWDSYDSAISTDINAWVGRANSSFGAYTAKTIAYGGVLKEGIPMDAAKANREALLLPFRNANRKLEFLNGTLVYGLGKRFGGTDGMVPYHSALLCANVPIPSSVSFSCSSPMRVRRFESGTVSVNTSNGLTLSITRTPRGYDHLDMLGHTHVLDWVVKDLLALVPRAMVSTSLTLSPPNGSYKTGESISGTFTIANRGGANLAMKRIVIGGRLAGTCPNNQCPDFTPGPSSITLAPGQTVSYSGTFNPSRAGNYTFAVAYENNDGTWVMPVEPENGNRNQVNINVTGVLPNVVVSKSLTVAPGTGPFPLGQRVNGSFSITNRGKAPITMRQILIAGRVGDTCPNNVCPDFGPIKPNVTLNPGETADYSGAITLTKEGTYTFYVSYQTPDQKWELPVKSENGNINQLSIVAQGPLPTLTGSSPASIAAGTTEQLVDLRGTRLKDILYCRLRAPNGTVTYIHGPLNQVIKVSDTQIRVKAKFLSRGTYIINAFTPEGRSNDFQIIVR